jgi:pimeloyl-ACP methyl ester carboxylesterase
VPVLHSFADGRLFGARWGDGPTAVLALHGWRRTHLDFAGLFGAGGTGGGRSVVAVDLPGFGATPPPPEPWGTVEYAELLVPLVDELAPDGGGLTVLGHSFGGRVALHLPRLAPGRVTRLVLTGVPLLPRDDAPTRPDAGYRLVRRLYRMGLVGEARMERARRSHGSADYRAAEGVMRQVFVRVVAERYAALLAEIGCAVDLVWGEDDGEVPVSVARQAATLLQTASLTVLPGVGHLTVVEAPDALRSLVLAPSGSGAPTGPA